MKDYQKAIVIDENNVALVAQWGKDRNIIEGATADSQFIKLISEIGEIFKGIRVSSEEEVIDGIGDALVLATIISEQYMGDKGLLRVLKTTNARRKLSSSWELGPHLWESVGYLADCIAKKESGESFLEKMAAVVQGLAFLAMLRNISLDAAYFAAYQEIKDRKGVMFNGVFIKENDPRYAEVVAALA